MPFWSATASRSASIWFTGCCRRRPSAIVALIRAFLIGGIFAWALPGSLDYIRFLWREHTPVLNLPLDLVYSCFGLFLVAVIARAAVTAAKLVGSHWRSEI